MTAELWNRWRGGHILGLSLMVYCVAVIVLALTPTDHIDPYEWITAALAVIALLGLLARTTTVLNLPGERWAFLVVGFVGLWTFCAYEIDSANPHWVKAWTGLFLLSGVLGGYGAHLAYPTESGPQR